MLFTTSAETQKWFDQNHTSRSAKPISAPIAASVRALISRLRFWAGGLGVAGSAGGGTAAMVASSTFGGSIGVATAAPPFRRSSLTRGAAGTASIEPARGPKPNRCNANGAAPFASSAMIEVLRTRRKSTSETEGHGECYEV